jgi:Ankyrin repeats (3 copies)
MKTLIASTIAFALLMGCGKPKPPDIDSWAAAATGNVKALKQHLAAGTDLDANSPSRGGTPLQLAAVFGQTEAARLLVKNGAKLEARDNYGSTPLIVAAFFCHPETVKLLVESGADVYATNRAGQTALGTVKGEWSPAVEEIYRYVGKTLKIKLDLERIKVARPEVARILR